MSTEGIVAANLQLLDCTLRASIQASDVLSLYEDSESQVFPALPSLPLASQLCMLALRRYPNMHKKVCCFYCRCCYVECPGVVEMPSIMDRH